MSPMSRWSRNWTPLTTRPSRTSRQGMILAAGIQRLREAELSFPKRLADDCAGSAGLTKRFEIGQRRDAARCLDFNGGAAGDDLFDQSHIGAGHHAVAADIRDEDVAGLRGGRAPLPPARGCGVAPP